MPCVRSRTFRPSRRLSQTLLTATVVVLIDAASKAAVRGSLELGERHELIGGVLLLTHVQNTGAAYGMLTGQRWLLVLMAVVVAAATPLLLRAMPAAGRWGWSGPILLGMILGGAAGNAVERAISGHVTDFVNVPPLPIFQVFNAADTSISLAITALLLLSFFDREPAAVPVRATTGTQADPVQSHHAVAGAGEQRPERPGGESPPRDAP